MAGKLVPSPTLGRFGPRWSPEGGGDVPSDWAASVPRDVRTKSPLAVPNERIPEHAERLLAGPVTRQDLALEFSDSSASSAETLVEGRSFYPRMLEDIGSASTSVHINQFGFRPGVVGDAFADALIEKAAEGVPVSLVIDRQGSDPERGSRVVLRSARGGGIEVGVVRATKAPCTPSDLSAQAAQRAGTWLRSGTSIIARWSSSTGASAGSAARASRTTSRTAASTTSSYASTVPSPPSSSSSSSPASAGSEGSYPSPTSTHSSHVTRAATTRFLHESCTTLPGGSGRSRTRSRGCSRALVETLDVVNPYVTDRGMIRRMEQAARRGVRVRLFVPANANNWACAAAQRHHHGTLLDAGVSILEYPTMLHAKAFLRDGEELLAGTCNLEAWSLKRFFEIDIRICSKAVALQFDERFSAPAAAESSPGRRLTGVQERLKAQTFAVLSPLL